MAIEFVGYASRNGTGFGSVSLSSLSGGIGGPVAQNDLILAYNSAGSTADRNMTIDGVTMLFDLYQNTSNDPNLGVGYLIAGSTPPSSVSFPHTGSSLTDGVVDMVEVWRGVDTTTPFDVTSTSAATTGNVTPNPPSITPITSGAVVVAIAHSTGSVTAPTLTSGPSGFSEFHTDISSATRPASIGRAHQFWSGSGAVDPGTFATSNTDTARGGWIAVTIALRPASSGVTNTDGTLSKSLDALTASGTGTVVSQITGTASKSMSALTTTAAGTVEVKAASSKSLSALTSSSSGKVDLVGTSSKTLGSLSGSLTAKVDVAATLSKSLGSLTCSAAGTSATVQIEGTASPSLGALSSSAAAMAEVRGISGNALQALTTASAAKVDVSGLTSGNLAPMSGSVTASAEVRGTSSATLNGITSASSAKVDLTGSAAIALGGVTSSSSSSSSSSGQLTATLGVLAGSAQGGLEVKGDCAPTLGPATATASGLTEVKASGSSALEGLVGAGLAAVAVAGVTSAPLAGIALESENRISEDLPDFFMEFLL